MDADRPNVELARLVGLSPAATLNRVRRLKRVGRDPRDRRAAGLRGGRLRRCRSTCWSRSRARTRRRSGASPGGARAGQVIAADWVTGETDALLMIVGPRRGRAAARALAAVHARGRAAADHAAAAGGAQAGVALPLPPGDVIRPGARADAARARTIDRRSMDVSGAALAHDARVHDRHREAQRRRGAGAARVDAAGRRGRDPAALQRRPGTAHRASEVAPCCVVRVALPGVPAARLGNTGSHPSCISERTDSLPPTMSALRAPEPTSSS